MTGLSSEQAGLLRDIDLRVLGRRLRNARLAAGLTQAHVAADDASTAYVSRIEAGQRRPDARLLEAMAGRLSTTVEELLLGVPVDRRLEVELELDHAELAVASGSAAEALSRADRALEVLDEASLPGLRTRGLRVRARALEALGRLDEAIIVLEDLLADGDLVDGLLSCAIALSRCYRVSGDLGRAIDVGERALDRLARLGLDGGDEAVQLAVTVAAAHHERGDVAHAARLCRRAIERAERLGSPRAKASAYWNASIMRSAEGDVAAAVPMAKKALALLDQVDDNRNLARLRMSLGKSQLALDPPALEEATLNLEQAGRELAWSSASPTDLAINEVALAKAAFLSGDVETAARRLDDVLVPGDLPGLVVADAWTLRGQLAASLGQLEDSRHCFRQAVWHLSAVGNDRAAAQLWFELAGLLQEAGDADQALDAYRRAGATAGLLPSRPRAVRPVGR